MTLRLKQTKTLLHCQITPNMHMYDIISVSFGRGNHQILQSSCMLMLMVCKVWQTGYQCTLFPWHDGNHSKPTVLFHIFQVPLTYQPSTDSSMTVCSFVKRELYHLSWPTFTTTSKDTSQDLPTETEIAFSCFTLPHISTCICALLRT